MKWNRNIKPPTDLLHVYHNWKISFVVIISIFNQSVVHGDHNFNQSETNKWLLLLALNCVTSPPMNMKRKIAFLLLSNEFEIMNFSFLKLSLSLSFSVYSEWKPLFGWLLMEEIRNRNGCNECDSIIGCENATLKLKKNKSIQKNKSKLMFTGR